MRFICLILLAVPGLVAAGGSWAWMGGPTLQCSEPSVDASSSCANTPTQPGARGCAHVFYDTATDLAFVWGGFGYDASGEQVALNDLWSFNASSLNWTHHGGNLKGGSHSTASWPGGRSYAAYAWDQASRSFYVFSGQGGINGNEFLPDLWRLDVKGGLVWSHVGNFTAPIPRKWSNFWGCDGALWVLGGEAAGGSNFNDLWKFEFASQKWVQIYDDGTANPYGVYTGSNATPGMRHNAFTTSFEGGLWMFGGSGWGSSKRGVVSDIWRFDTQSLRWSFKGGNPGGVEQDGTCGPRGQGSTGFLPTARHAGMNFDFTSSKRLVVVGGEHHPNKLLASPESNLLIFDDIWTLDLVTGAWAHEGGDCDVPNLPNLTRGQQGVPANANSPQSRYGGNGWVDSNGSAWIFGGGFTGYTNDIWRFSWERAQ